MIAFFAVLLLGVTITAHGVVLIDSASNEWRREQ